MAAQAAKQKADKEKVAKERAAGADFKAAFGKAKVSPAPAGDGGGGVSGGGVSSGSGGGGGGVDGDDGRDSNIAFPVGDVGEDSVSRPNTQDGGGGGGGGGFGGMGDIFAVTVNAMNDKMLPELQCDELAAPSRVKAQSMQCVEILTSLKQKGKVFVQEILALETGGDVEEQALARKSLATLGLHDSTGLLALETQRLFGDNAQNMSQDQKARESLAFVRTLR